MISELALAAFEKCVLNDNARHEIRRVGALIWRTNVATGVDARVGRLQPIVDLHALRAKLDAYGFEDWC